MNTQEVNDFVQRERTRWVPAPRDVSDADLLRRRERLLNGLTMFFALLALVSLFWAGLLGWGVWGWYLSVVVAAFLARQCGAHANRCRDVREFLQRPHDRLGGQARES